MPMQKQAIWKHFQISPMVESFIGLFPLSRGKLTAFSDMDTLTIVILGLLPNFFPAGV